MTEICGIVLGRHLVYGNSTFIHGPSHSPFGQEQVNGVAVIPWTILQIYESAKDHPVLGRKIFGSPTSGTHVAWYPASMGRPAAYGSIVSLSTGSSSTDSRRHCKSVVIYVSQVLVPGRIVDVENKALEDFDTLPFHITVLQSELRTWRAVQLPSEDARPTSSGTDFTFDDFDATQTADDEMPFDGDYDSDSDSDGDSFADDTMPNLRTQSQPSTSAAIISSHYDTVEANGLNGLGLNQLQTRVLKDIFHLMDMVKVSKRHGIAKEFSRRLRDAIFICDEEDRRRVEAFLVSQGQNWEGKLLTNPAWIFKRVRRLVPPPEMLHPVVRDLFDAYGPLICPKSGRPLFDDHNSRIAANVLDSIMAGHVSDPPGVSFYFRMGVYSQKILITHKNILSTQAYTNFRSR